MTQQTDSTQPLHLPDDTDVSSLHPPIHPRIWNFLTAGAGVATDVVPFSHRLLLNCLGLMGVVVGTGFGLYHYLAPIPLHGAIPFLIAAAAALVLAFVRVTGRYRVASWALSGIIGAAFLFGFCVGLPEHPGYLWSFIVPIGTVFLHGPLTGTVLTFGYLGITLFLRFSGILPFLAVLYPPKFMVVFAVVFSALWCMAMVISFVIDLSHRHILENNTVLRTALARIWDERERALKSEKRFRDLAEMLPEIVFEMDMDGRLRFVNKRAFDITGYSREELKKGMNGLAIIHPSDLARAKERLVMLARGEETGGMEYTAIRKDGTTFPAFIRSLPIFHDGEVTGIRGFIIDVSELKRAEEALRAAEREKELILNSVSEAVIHLDLDHTILWSNRAAAPLDGMGSDEIVGSRCYEVWYQRAAPCTHCPVSQAIYTGLAHEAEQTGPSGETWRIRAYPVRDDDGTSTGAVVIVRDITEQKHLESRLAQAQRMETVGRLAGGVAHDFNNLLTVITGKAELSLLRQDDQKKILDNLAVIHATSQRAADLIRQLLSISRTPVVRASTIDLNRVIGDTRGLLDSMIDKGITLRIYPSPDIHPIEADPSQMEQVIVNLVINARDALPDGGTITIETRNIDITPDMIIDSFGIRPGPGVELSVRDTGIGMDTSTIEKIFEPFFTTKQEGKGTGLGLSTCYAIIRENHGCILVTSAPGKGTTMRVVFMRSPKTVAAMTEAGDSTGRDHGVR